MNPSRRDRLRAAAATSALAALGLPDRALAAAPVTWVPGVCDTCERRCGVELALEGGALLAVRAARSGPGRVLLCPEGFLLPERLAPAGRAKGAGP